MNQVIDSVFRILILLFSIIVHEVSHGATAYALGDDTAKNEGRLTLNPLPHIDPVGTILLPLFIGFGWAKPVPYNPYNLRNQKWGPFLVGIAGPASNIIIAVIFGLLFRFSDIFSLPEKFLTIIASITILNLGLALFNLIPIPPLDGSKIFSAIYPRGLMFFESFGSYGFMILLVIVFFTPFLDWTILPAMNYLFRLITGAGF
ncbi:hypothetical protein A2W54_01380 [Candidatus Giovannonibacteria bacterium RIFCSPHIGHO2_02_43_13]|uniref:Peptidase M50 domain-containing protein n=1 Tax=Candidatus Giovannonibacteria bacterium RIFCSPHIGHO2_02_43_13 TaxID=1798330 RepID=A0A1F5WUN6_9BACT|nr:MAG: hypothetical protein A3E06_01515 [Candidatus Giovannonibacteria bacterium RIFCSPHIGHO2_12_FULL_44_42]OGF79365.1 MAG: hypothetical protein A2W54_01380 [Candidatus Giovannonibacteria bacterium RIFCSPHIGHO2_02_43_13]OGF89934.1 MAG: hypothetical protein A3I94_00885 [Candidatus Giovannonibacteria bacterium RIFCSPLOWO2_02_FULL_43_54]OGF97332.1 MAG: hypothetical protein A3H08_03085 [Candidatus Giovannonibacteria bacterium RIFCSPLOWO2_12_FULL_44_32]